MGALAEPVADLAAARAVLTGYAQALLTLLTSPASVELNRAAMASAPLAEHLLASGRRRIGPLVEDFLAGLDRAGLARVPDPEAAYSMFYGLVVQDTQIGVLLGGLAPNPAQVRARADTAVTGFLRLLG